VQTNEKQIIIRVMCLLLQYCSCGMRIQGGVVVVVVVLIVAYSVVCAIKCPNIWCVLSGMFAFIFGCMVVLMLVVVVQLQHVCL
jgi:hypothetical protein